MQNTLGMGRILPLFVPGKVMLKQKVGWWCDGWVYAVSHVINPCKCVRLHMHTTRSFSRDFSALKLRDDPWHKQKLSLALPEKQKLAKRKSKKENGWAWRMYTHQILNRNPFHLPNLKWNELTLRFCRICGHLSSGTSSLILMTISVYPPSLEIFIPVVECDKINVSPKTTRIDFDTISSSSVHPLRLGWQHSYLGYFKLLSVDLTPQVNSFN